MNHNLEACGEATAERIKKQDQDGAFRSRSPLRGWEGKTGGVPGVEVHKERRQRTPAGGALVSEGFSSETDPAGGRKETPAGGFEIPARFVDWGVDEPYSDPRLSPRTCLNRQAGFTAARPAPNWIPSSAAA